MSSSHAVHIFNPEGHPPQAPTYSHISTVPLSSTTRLVSFAGQVGVPPPSASSPAPEAPSFADQVRAALANVDVCLAAAGVGKKDIISNRQYVVKLASLDASDFNARADILMDWWRSTEGERLLPPDTLIGVDSLAGKAILFEIEITCIASL